MVEFVEINEENYETVLKLKVTDEQNEAKYIAPNVRSIADAYLYREAGDVFPYAVQDGETVVGFVLLDEDEEEKELMIWRMMVDKDYQGKGYGKAIVEKVIEQFEADSRFDVLIADYIKGNDVMGKLLKSLGFEYGEFDAVNNEYVMEYK
ncbi:MAG TPA: N-acetyltransferase [Jeotgalicoccus sp.]|nr:N-acetyltransferase [Jeotgalicoccus sp.]